MSTIPTQSQNPEGLHHRYKIQKAREEVYFERRWMATSLFTGSFADVIEDIGDKKRRTIYTEVDKKAEYFVLRLDEAGSDIEHIKACRVGVHAYANAIEHHLPELAKDLRERYPLL